MLLPTHGHSVHEDMHLDESPILHNGGTPPTGRYGTRGHTDDKVEQQHKIGKPHRHGEGSFDTEGTLRQIYQRVRELQNEALCERASTLLQLLEVWRLCQDMHVGNPDLHILRRKTLLPPMQGQQTTDTQMCKLRTGARHYKSPLPKENGSREESKYRTSVTTNHTKTGQQETTPTIEQWMKVDMVW